MTQAQAEELNGYLHMRFYQQEQSDFAPLHEKDGEKIAYAYTTAYPKESYMGLYISDLHFYARSWAQENDTDHPAYHGDDGGHHSSQAGQQRQ